MKNIIKESALVLIMIVIFAAFLSACSTFRNETIKYSDVEGGKALNRYTGSSKITTLTIPDMLDDIEVVAINKYAISSAEYLKTIQIGKNVSYIDPWAISNCPKLEKIIVDPQNQHYMADELGVLYNKQQTELIYFPALATKEFSVPKTITKIDTAAFYLCSGLTKIEFNEGLLEIGDYAFLKCESLQNFTLPSTLLEIGKDSFSFCNTITQLTIPKSVTHIGDYAFFSTYSSLKEIILQKPQSEFVRIGDNWAPIMKDSGNKKVEIKVVP